MILDQVKKNFIQQKIQDGEREDGRGFFDYRPIRIQKGFVPNAEGSCLAQIGDTKVLCGVKFDVMAPFADRPEEGVFMTNAEFAPLAHPDFHPGPPNEDSIELARVVDRGIRSAELLDVKNMFLEEGKVLGLFVDLYILDHEGNLMDTAALAAMGALLDTKVPKYEGGKIVRNEFLGPLKLSDTVVTTSFERIGSQIIVDAAPAEETASSGRLTLGTADGDLICATQKSGRAGITRPQYDEMMDVAFQKHGELADALKG
ncbi:exosome complex protein Rrp42 [Candidatus Micrarchaeota archaeon]|nr:exosome complex protein Rrp42 [Candidatus Micrarchaeota archaeon]